MIQGVLNVAQFPVHEFSKYLEQAVGYQVNSGQMDVDYQGYYPAELYLNGQYWGIHNIREKLNEHYEQSFN